MDIPTTLLKQYEETGKVWKIFIDWRHKVMSRFFIALTAIFISIQWMYTIQALKKWIFLPLLAGAIFSIVIACMDMTNTRILNSCTKLGREIEEKLIKQNLFAGPALYQKLQADYDSSRIRRRFAYRSVLKKMYLGTAGILLLFSFITFYKFYLKTGAANMGVAASATERKQTNR